MFAMLATIVAGKLDAADVFFLIAVILFAAVAVVRAVDRQVDGFLFAAGMAFGFLGLLVL